MKKSRNDELKYIYMYKYMRINMNVSLYFDSARNSIQYTIFVCLATASNHLFIVICQIPNCLGKLASAEFGLTGPNISITDSVDTM